MYLNSERYNYHDVLVHVVDYDCRRRKPKGKVRICLDQRDLNRGILRLHYPFKTVEKVAATLQDTKNFSTLDAASGFYQIKLTERSTGVTTFNTPYGRPEKNSFKTHGD